MKILALIAAMFAFYAPNLPMYCADTVISEGDTAQRVLTLCGTPDEISGSTWVYIPKRIGKYQASYWFYLWFDDGILISIDRN